MTNLRRPPPCALPCTARGCCSFAKPTGRRGRRCMPLHPCSAGTSAPPGLCILPRSISRHFQHAALAPLSRGSSTLAPPLDTRRCAAQHRRAGGQGDDGFISENKRNAKRRRVRRRGGIQRDMKTAILITKMKTMRRFLVQLQNKMSLQSFTTNRFNAAVAFAYPSAAARRYHRMASALSCATPLPSSNKQPNLLQARI